MAQISATRIRSYRDRYHPRCAKLAFPEGVRVFTGDASDANTLDNMLGGEKLDIIVDDGSHVQADIIASFLALMPRLAFGGKYIIEDLHCSYLDSFGGGFRTNTSALEFFKSLADGLNLDHFTAALAGDQLQSLEMINGQVCRISFYNSLVVFEKYCEPKTLRFPRVLAGEQLKVTGAVVFSEAVVADADNFRLFGGSAKPIINAALHAVRQSAGQHYHALQETRSQLAQYRGELEARCNDIQQLQQRVAELQAAIVERDAALAGEHQELAAVRAALADAEQGRAALQEMVGAHQAAVTELTGAHQAAVTELTGAHQAAVTELTGARQSWRSALAELETAQSRLATLEREQARESETLRGEITALREQLSQREQQAAAYAETARSREAEAASLRQAVAAAEHVAKSALRALATEPGIPIAPEPRRFRRWFAFLTPLTQSTGL